MNNIEKKLRIIAICREEIAKRVSVQTTAMNDAQETANKYKGAMESRYDTFKEEAQQRRDAHARQIDTLLKKNSALMDVGNKNGLTAGFGSVVETENEIFFICFHITDDQILIDGKELITLREDTQLGMEISGKKKGDVIQFCGRATKILDVY